MRKSIIISILIAWFPFTNYSQDCAINLVDSLFVCGFETVLTVDTDGGSWTFDCAGTDQTFTVESLSMGENLLKFSACGIYTINYAVEVPGICSNDEDIIIYVENPSTTTTSYGHSNTLEYQGISCHSSGNSACVNMITIGGQSPPIPIWDICSEAACSSQITSTTVDNPNQNCEADNILVNTVDLSVSSTSCWTGEQDGFLLVDPITGELINNGFEDFLDSLLLADVLAGFAGCDVFTDPCFELSESCIDSIEFDTITRLFPVHLGGQWHYLSNTNDTIPLMDSTVLTINFEDYLFIISPGSDYYGPENIEFSIYQLVNNGQDTIEPFQTVEFRLQWLEAWKYDSTEVVIPDVVYVDSIGCQMCGGDFFNSFYNIPEIPSYPCGAISLSFDYGCICEPIDVFVNGTNIDCQNDCASLEGFVNSNIGYFSEWITPEGGNIQGDFIAACDPGEYIYFVVTDDGCFFEEYYNVSDERVDIEINIPQPDIITNDQECVDLLPDVMITPNSQANYTWQGPNGFSSSDESVSVCEPGEYTLTVLSLPGFCEESASVVVEEQLEVIEPLSAQVCSGDCFDYQGESYCVAGVYLIELDELLTVELTLEVLEPEEEFLEESICSGDVFEVNGNSYTQSGSYNYTISSADICDTIVYLELEVLEEETLFLTESICDGDTLILDGNTFYETGNYEFYVASSYLCDAHVYLDLEILPGVPAIQDQYIETCMLESVSLKLNESLSEFNITWDNGQSGLIREIQSPGIYSAEISNGCGTEDLIFEVVDIQMPDIDIVFPNIFSPNNDGVNDNFSLVSNKTINQYHLRVFDRWGSLMYDSTNPEDSWDGRHNGQSVPSNSYVYQVSLTSELCGGQLIEETYSGSILLVR